MVNKFHSNKESNTTRYMAKIWHPEPYLTPYRRVLSTRGSQEGAGDVLEGLQVLEVDQT